MKLFLDYISKIKFYIILQLFPVILAEIIFFLYQLPIEPMVYVTVFWLMPLLMQGLMPDSLQMHFLCKQT